MTERERMVMLSAFSVTSLAFAASWGLVTRPTPVAAAAEPAPIVLADTAPAGFTRAEAAPAPGLSPAPAPRRKVVVVRRSRAS